MKKLMGILAFCVLTAGAVCAQTVTVTNPPPGGVTWIKGTTYTITWTKSGTMPNLVRLSLRDPVSLAELNLIQDNVSNTGTWPWTIPADIVDGQYRLRVKVKDVAVQDDSDIFNIAAVAPPGTITVLEPWASTVWRDGQVHEVNWKVTGNLPGNFSISLMNSAGTVIVQTLSAPVLCCSLGALTFPSPFIPGSYLIRVRNISTNVFGDSPVFTLSPDTIIVTQPKYNSYWEKTKTYNITWKNIGTVPNTVKIELTIPASYTVLAQAAPNTGSFSWTVPSGVPVGNYNILILTSVDGLYGKSPSFHITYIKIPTPVVITKKKK